MRWLGPFSESLVILLLFGGLSLAFLDLSRRLIRPESPPAFWSAFLSYGEQYLASTRPEPKRSGTDGANNPGQYQQDSTKPDVLKSDGNRYKTGSQEQGAEISPHAGLGSDQKVDSPETKPQPLAGAELFQWRFVNDTGAHLRLKVFSGEETTEILEPGVTRSLAFAVPRPALRFIAQTILGERIDWSGAVGDSRENELVTRLTLPDSYFVLYITNHSTMPITGIEMNARYYEVSLLPSSARTDAGVYLATAMKPEIKIYSPNKILTFSDGLAIEKVNGFQFVEITVR